jgi:hypothetical protein
MKQFLLSTAIFLMTASSNHSSAQSSNDIALNLAGLIAETSGNIKVKATEARATEVSIRAMRDFTRAFKNVPEVKWFKSESGEFASFVSNGTHTKVLYDKKGRRSYSLVSYTESKLDRNIRHLVKSSYYDATIIGVHQFEFDNKTVYAIKMLDQQSNPLTLKVCDGRIEDITSQNKK